MPNNQKDPVRDRLRNERMLMDYTWLWSLALLAAVIPACLYSGEGTDIFSNFRYLLFSPAQLTPDYFDVGSLGASLLNAGLCGLSVDLVLLLSRVRFSSTLLAGYYLIIAHCFYGLNILNMWLPLLAVLLYTKLRKVSLQDTLHIALFSTSLGPFITFFLFYYGRDVSAGPQFTPGGLLLAILFSLTAAFLIPALLPGTTRMHRGFNLYKAGLAIGLFGIFAYAFFYKMLGVAAAPGQRRSNPLYASAGCSYGLFMNVFFLCVFLLTILLGWLKNGKSFRGYRKLWRCDSWQDDFPAKFGTPLTWINIGLYGLCVLLYLDLTLLLTEGVGFTGPVSGAVIAAITFSAAGQTVRNVWPVTLGYILLYGVVRLICLCTGLPVSWSLSLQPYINGIAFATGLCPFTGRYGMKYGIIAGVLDAILCTSTAAMHGGFMLYNGGLTAGLTALLLLPVLDFYKVPEREYVEGE